MVNELLDRDMRREFRKTADMVVVVVRDNQVIDLLDAGVIDGRHNAPCIANGAVSTVPSIDEHRFPGRDDKKNGIAALHVDHINI